MILNLSKIKKYVQCQFYKYLYNTYVLQKRTSMIYLLRTGLGAIKWLTLWLLLYSELQLELSMLDMNIENSSFE